MHPILFEIGNWPVYSYGVLLAAAYLAGLQMAVVRARRVGLDGTRVMDLGIYLIIAALVGAKLMLVAVDFDYFRSQPREMLSLVRAGGVFYGGLILSTIVGLLLVRRYKLPVWRVARDLRDPVSERADRRARERDLQEQRRLLYVAMTRAQDHLIVAGWKRNRQGEPTWYALIEAARPRLPGVAPCRVAGLDSEGWRYANRPQSLPAQQRLELGHSLQVAQARRVRRADVHDEVVGETRQPLGRRRLLL